MALKKTYRLLGHYKRQMRELIDEDVGLPAFKNFVRVEPTIPRNACQTRFSNNQRRHLVGKPYDEPSRFFTEGHAYLNDGRTNTKNELRLLYEYE